MLLALAINIFSKSANVNNGRHFEIKFCRQLVQCTVSLVQLCAIYAGCTTVKRVLHVWVYILYPLVLHDLQSKQTTVNSGQILVEFVITNILLTCLLEPQTSRPVLMLKQRVSKRKKITQHRQESKKRTHHRQELKALGRH